MTTLEFCRKRREAETPMFIRVLKAIPDAKPGYRPDPKSRTAAEIAWVLTQEEAALASLLAKGSTEWKEEKAPAKVADIVAAFERHAAEVNAHLKKLDETGWQKKGTFLMGGQPWEDTMEQFVWGFLFDAIHHRGQITTYLRAMGSKVPSLYGPSADDPGH